MDCLVGQNNQFEDFTVNIHVFKIFFIGLGVIGVTLFFLLFLLIEMNKMHYIPCIMT